LIISQVISKESKQLYALKKINLAGVTEVSIDECINEVEMLVDLKDSELVVKINGW